MNLTLAMVLSCDSEGCLVQPLNSDTTLEARYSYLKARYSAAMLNYIKIRPAQLVAVDRASDPPEIVWRWYYGVVKQIKDAEIVVDDTRAQLITAKKLEGLSDNLTIGDKVFLARGLEAGWVIYDIALDGRPAHPEHLQAVTFPGIIEMYRQRQMEGA